MHVYVQYFSLATVASNATLFERRQEVGGGTDNGGGLGMLQMQLAFLESVLNVNDKPISNKNQFNSTMGENAPPVLLPFTRKMTQKHIGTLKERAYLQKIKNKSAFSCYLWEGTQRGFLNSSMNKLSAM